MMLVEDVFEQVRSHTYIPVTLEELSETPASCLQALDHLLKQLEASEEAAKANASEAQEKVAHLTSSISHLTEQNGILQTRLIASLDALSARSNDELEKSRQENEALRLLNQNLGMRLQEAYRENAELHDMQDAAVEPSRLVNSNSAIRRSHAVANEYIASAKVISATQQDYDDGISDAGTEIQANYAGPLNVGSSGQAGSSNARQPDVQLRTRTILLELANELEASRREFQVMQEDKEESTRLMQKQVENRNKDLSTLYRQLDKFFGLPGFALRKSRRKVSIEVQEANSPSLEDHQEIAQALRQQLQDLKVDIERLHAERDNLARYGAGAPWSSAHSDQITEEDDGVAARFAEQEASFEKVAQKARERLLHQEAVISSLRSELSKAQHALHATQESRYEDVFSSREIGGARAARDRLDLGTSIQRPRSAFADPYAGSTMSKEDLPKLSRSSGS